MVIHAGLNDLDLIFPGENWFFYWKTSASLWQEKLRRHESQRIIIPINWGFHSDTGDDVDFGDKRPETDLKRLVTACEKEGKDIVFFLFVTPAPFLTNGGIPYLLARSLSVGSKRLAFSVIDQEGRINKLYSYFDPRLFKAFSKFTKKLGEYFSRSGIASDLFSVEAGFLRDSGFVSFIEDRSKMFEQSFVKYLRIQKEESSSGDALISSPREENMHKLEYTKTIEELYQGVARAHLASNWEKLIKIAFLGAGEEDFFYRCNDSDHHSKFFSDSILSLRYDALVSSCLLSGKVKNNSFGQFLKSQVHQGAYLAKLNPSDDDFEFRPLRFFEIYENPLFSGLSKVSWGELGLLDFFDENFVQTATIKRTYNIQAADVEVDTETYYLFQGGDLDENDFKSVLKIFMSGGRVILNKSGLAQEILKRLEMFIIENSLKTEKINYITNVEYATLGEGKLLLFDGEKAVMNTPNKLISFWKKIFSTFEIEFFDLKLPENVFHFWLRRSTGATELSYEEVRRLSLYNPSSYKRKFSIDLKRNFVLIKVINEVNATVTSSPHHVDIELLPEGSMVLDFGLFLEGR